MSTGTWHLDDELTRRYAEGRAPAVLAASVEQHVLACGRCRGQLTGYVDAGRLEAGWAAVLDRVETPRPSLVERLLTRAGVDPGTARLAAATPVLRGAWLTAVVVVLALALLAAHSDPSGVAVFLALAPVLPLLGVAAAFGPHADPSHELVAAAPYPVARLLAVRTALVVATTLVPAALLAVLLPEGTWRAVGWLLPALAMTTGSLALGAWVPAHRAALVLSGGWVGLVLLGLVEARDPYLATHLAVQLTSAAALAMAVGSLLTHADRLSEQVRRTP